jgi:hypothetical protein
MSLLNAAAATFVFSGIGAPAVAIGGLSLLVLKKIADAPYEFSHIPGPQERYWQGQIEKYSEWPDGVRTRKELAHAIVKRDEARLAKK